MSRTPVLSSLVAVTFAGCLLWPTAARAVGPNDPDEPQPSPTTTVCEAGKIWDTGVQRCVLPRESRLSDDEKYGAVRELAHAGRNSDARAVLDTMREGPTDRVLTYRGFLLRKSGAMDDALDAYDAALRQNPDNLLARSYLGQGLLEIGDIAGARAQLSEIRRRGGRSTWAEVSLRLALGAGRPVGY